MKTRNHEHHFFDIDGNPEGGQSFGNGYAIAWQRGPLGRGDGRSDPNGAFVEDVIQSVIARIEFYQSSRFACDFNADALTHLRAAADALNARTIEREKRQVEGTHKE